jgi:hypothetical protein
VLEEGGIELRSVHSMLDVRTSTVKEGDSRLDERDESGVDDEVAEGLNRTESIIRISLSSERACWIGSSSQSRAS